MIKKDLPNFIKKDEFFPNLR